MTLMPHYFTHPTCKQHKLQLKQYCTDCRENTEIVDIVRCSSNKLIKHFSYQSHLSVSFSVTELIH